MMVSACLACCACPCPCSIASLLMDGAEGVAGLADDGGRVARGELLDDITKAATGGRTRSDAAVARRRGQARTEPQH